MEEKFEMHSEILQDMHDLYIKKNTDYGDSVRDTYLRFGPVSYLVRMYDKLNRIHHLTSTNTENPNVADESIQDSLIDLANYAILMAMELKLDKKEGKIIWLK